MGDAALEYWDSRSGVGCKECLVVIVGLGSKASLTGLVGPTDEAMKELGWGSSSSGVGGCR